MAFKGKILEKFTRHSPSTSPQLSRADHAEDKSRKSLRGSGRKRENLSKNIISGPQDFRAVSHVTYDGRGFTVDGSDSMSRGDRRKMTKELDQMAKLKQDKRKVALDNRIISVLPVSEPAPHDDSFDSSFEPPCLDSPMTASFFDEVMEEVSRLDLQGSDVKHEIHDTGSTSDDTGVSSGASANGDDVTSRDERAFSTTSGGLNDTRSSRSSGIDGSRSRVSDTGSSTARLSEESDEDELERSLSGAGTGSPDHEDAFCDTSDEETEEHLKYCDDDIVDL